MPLSSVTQWAPRPGPISIFAIEDHSAQLVWRNQPEGPVEVALTEVESQKAQTISVDHRGGPAALILDGLRESTGYEVVVGAHRLRFRTLPTPPGELLFRVATVNDVHIGSWRFGLTKMMKERPQPEVGSGDRCAAAAFADINAWTPDHLVIKGDFVHDRQPEEWAFGHALVEQLNVPWDFCLGNHETWDGDSRAVLADWGYDCTKPVRVTDRPGIRLVMGDTALDGSDLGAVHHIHDDILDAVAESDRPVLLLLHHNLQPRRQAWMVPSGVPGPEANRLLDAIADVRPDTLVTSGHTHRHRLRMHRGIPVTEVGSTKDYPGTWAGYTVHEGGIRQTVRRVSAPDCLAWTDYTRKGALGTWGRWSPGSLADRCFTHPWPLGINR